MVTHRVKDELGYCLGDGSAKIRQAAYQLAERIGDPSLVEVVAPHAQSSDLDVWQPAIRCLANLGSEEAAQVLVTALKSPRGADHPVACAQALRQIADPVAVDALATLLLRKKHWFGGWKWDDHVRATADMALRQIRGPEAEQVLARAGADPKPRIREVPRGDRRPTRRRLKPLLIGRLARRAPTRARPSRSGRPRGSLGAGSGG